VLGWEKEKNLKIKEEQPMISSFLVILVHGISEGEDHKKTVAVKKKLKQLIEVASGFPTINMMVFFQQNIRFQDTSEGIYCEVKWPQVKTLPREPKNLKKDISGLLKEIFGITKVRVDFKA